MPCTPRRCRATWPSVCFTSSRQIRHLHTFKRVCYILNQRGKNAATRMHIHPPVLGQGEDRVAVQDGVEVGLQVVLVADVPDEDGLVEARPADGALHRPPRPHPLFGDGRHGDEDGRGHRGHGGGGRRRRRRRPAPVRPCVPAHVPPAQPETCNSSTDVDGVRFKIFRSKKTMRATNTLGGRILAKF